MSLRINQNIAAVNAYRNLNVSDSQMAKSLEKLSSGFRINRAADDAAGLVISEGLRAQVGGLKVAVRNAQDGISVVQTAEGALNEVHSILQRMRDLAVQASNTGSQGSDATGAAQKELDQLKLEIDRIAGTTAFGSTKLLNGTFGAQGVSTAAGTDTAFATNPLSGTANQVGVSINGGTATQLVLTNTAAASGYTSDAAGAAAMQANLQKDIDLNVALKGKLSAVVTDGSTGLQVSFTLNSNTVGDTLALSAGTSNSAASALGLSTALVTVAAGANGTFQVGANSASADRIELGISKVDAASLGLSTLSVSTATNARAAMDNIDSAIGSISSTRANLGAAQNRFEHTIANLNVSVENISASESRIRDVDMAQEMVTYTRNQIMTQAGTAMLAQANSAPQGVLQLLRG